MNKLIQMIVFTVLTASIFVVNNPKSASAEIVVVHANQAWQLTDIILKKDHVITWKVEEEDYWSFNTTLFPDGHDAEGIPVPALESYTLPGENIGKLLGKTGQDRVMSMGLSGSEDVLYGEEGCYLYLSMNDDLIGKFGVGFKDNYGEILVTVIQIPMSVVDK